MCKSHTGCARQSAYCPTPPAPAMRDNITACSGRSLPFGAFTSTPRKRPTRRSSAITQAMRQGIPNAGESLAYSLTHVGPRAVAAGTVSPCCWLRCCRAGQDGKAESSATGLLVQLLGMYLARLAAMVGETLFTCSLHLVSIQLSLARQQISTNCILVGLLASDRLPACFASWVNYSPAIHLLQ